MIARALLPVLLLPTLVLAQEQVTTPGPQSGPTTTAPETWHVAINPYGSYAFDADFHDTGSSFSVSRAGVSADGRISMSADLKLDLGITGEYSNYQFSRSAPATDFSLDLFDVLFAPGLEYKLSDQWSIFGGALLESAAGTSGDFDDAFTYGGYVGAKHKVSEHLSYTFGVAAKTRIEDDMTVYPVLGIDWDITKSLSLTSSASSSGGQIRLTQALCSTMAISAVAGYEFREFRLDSAPIPNGVMQDSRIPVGAELAWKPNDGFSARLTAGYVVWQEIEFDDPNGYKLSRAHPDPTPYVGISANWQF